MGADRQGLDQQELCFKEFGHKAVNQDGDSERVGC